jgi:hypothetical protein
MIRYDYRIDRAHQSTLCVYLYGIEFIFFTLYQYYLFLIIDLVETLAT